MNLFHLTSKTFIMQVDEKRWFTWCDNRVYDSAKICELVGIFLLDKISVKYDKNSIVLYHDKVLSVFKNSTWKNKK